MENKRNKICRFLIGVPASGKSTWSKDYVQKNPKWARVGRDDFRFMLKDLPVCDPKVESTINRLMDDSIVTLLSNGFSVLVDNTNLKAKYINPIIDLVSEMSDVEFQIFDISVNKAIERDSNRERKVGAEVIKRMYKDYQILLDTFDFSHRTMRKKAYIEPKFNKKLPDCAIFDIDGTLAHMSGKRGPFDWNKVDRDDLDAIVSRMTHVHKAYGDTILIVSGRDEEAREKTIEWLEFYEIPYDKLLMRPKGDMRKDSIIKKEIYKGQIMNNYNIRAIYDDRDQVVKMIREELGLKCFQVQTGQF